MSDSKPSGSMRPVVCAAPKPGDRLTMTDGATVTLGEQFGQGGQGRVYAVRDNPDRCVKVYMESDVERTTALRTRFDKLRQKQASDQLVLPLAVLAAPHAGYLMRRVRDAEPLSGLAVIPRGVQVDVWFKETGGLRRRLLIANELVSAFYDLHVRGLSYGDLSWENVLVPKVGRPQVHLIDCDNLSVDGAIATGIQGTQWFIAPELVRGHTSPDSVSDQHALAVLLYYIFALGHPLLGDRIRAGTPEDEQAALRAEWPFTPGRGKRLPWVDHPEDERNRSTALLDRGLVLSRLMQGAFNEAFGAALVGPDRVRRPTEGRWLEILGRATDATVQCGCGHTYYVSAKACPWCGAPRAPHWVLLCRHPDGRRPVVVQRMRRLYPRHLELAAKKTRAEPFAIVSVADKAVVVEPIVPLCRVADDLSPSEELVVGRKHRLAAGAMFTLAGRQGAIVEVREG